MGRGAAGARCSRPRRCSTSIFEHAPVGIALLDTRVRYVRVNDRLAEINGVPAAEHAGRTVGDLLPDLPAAVQADVERVARTASR